ncbi:olfactory receptor 13A1-like [Bufo gargarizans]|uniref:olfactory receptor 13A1-like n=1 Tax=Bufo gargarizans TaxID=30331 RepID=UPI001CF38288|nr:olfactory receptor 13A1-like [Bufo gargarizans]XP_044127209.1 olfactory receptor 13A1-like [Bufo gargarizans]
MEDRNKTFVTEFILLAFSEFHQYQILLFTVVLFAYIACITGNMTIILMIIVEQSLHVPMYYFISIFAAEEILMVSIVIPKLLAILMAGNQKISFINCFVQLYIFITLGQVVSICIMIMAYDRHLAINKPLHYTVIMNQTLCIGLVILPWIFSLSSSLIVTLFTMFLDFCGPNKVNNFFCEVCPLQSLACSDTYIINTVTTTAAAIATVLPFIIIVGLYTKIIMTVFKIKSSLGKQKAFSTCSSHLIVAMLFFMTVFIIYLTPYDSQRDKYYSLIYFLINPVVNPFIYALRNRDVRNILKKYLKFQTKLEH